MELGLPLSDTLPYIGRWGHTRLTILRLSDYRLHSGCTVGQGQSDQCCIKPLNSSPSSAPLYTNTRGYWHQWADERWIQEPLVVRDKDGRPQQDPLAVHCFCVCSGSVLLGDLLGVSRYMERDLVSVLCIYPMFLCVCSLCIVAFFVFVYSAIIWCIYLYSGLVANTCPPPSVWPHLFCGAGHKKRRGELLKWSLAFRLYIGSFVFHVQCAQLPKPVHTAPLGRVCFTFSLGLYFVCLYCFNLFVCPHRIVFPWAVESCTLQALA